jgi:hypothetical protein
MAVARRRAQVGGSDAHTLRRVGRTWTEAPGDSREAFLANLAAGHGRVGGDHGGTLPLAADIYGVIARYHLGVLGLERLHLEPARRAFGIAFAAVALPFHFIELIVAARSKWQEARAVRAAAPLLDPQPGPAIESLEGGA